MTPAQLDHLRRIDAHLVNLLSTAEKRTPGEWTHEMQCDSVWSDHDFDLQIAHTMSNPGAGMMWDADQRRNNAAFIASCAGNAEAGWRATRLAIKTLLEYTGPLTPQIEREYAKEKLGEIIALFPNV